jgi:hypothetical protein
LKWDVCFTPDTVAKVVLHRWSKILRAVGAVFVYGPEGPRRLTLNSSATLMARQRLHESSISARFKFSPKIQTVATFDFCNRIPPKADIGQSALPTPTSSSATASQFWPHAKSRQGLPRRLVPLHLRRGAVSSGARTQPVLALIWTHATFN